MFRPKTRKCPDPWASGLDRCRNLVHRRLTGPSLPMDRVNLHLLIVQHGLCVSCQGLLLRADGPSQNLQEWERWLSVIRMAIAISFLTTHKDGAPEEMKLCLIHAQCQRQNVVDGKGAAALPACCPSGLAWAGCDESRKSGSEGRVQQCARSARTSKSPTPKLHNQ